MGEYHLDLVAKYGGCPIIVPRVENIALMLQAFEPFHGLLLCEGEDISEGFLPAEHALPANIASSIKAAHPSDVAVDVQKDTIEFELVRQCLSRSIPILGICRGSQIINVVAGGTIVPDVDTFINKGIKHIDYTNYDGHRHPISVLPGTPMKQWFDDAEELSVNSYHHQGIDLLAARFVPMALSSDGLVEGFYDPNHYDIEQGKFVIGLQFHPERMQDNQKAMAGDKNCFDYPGCPRPYESFLRAAYVYRNKIDSLTCKLRNRPCLLPDAIMDQAISASRKRPKRVASAIFPEPIPEVLYSTNGSCISRKLSPAENHAGQNKCNCSRADAPPRNANFLQASQAISVYTRDDLKRLIKSGASVHGVTIVQRLLHDEFANAEIQRRFKVARPEHSTVD